MRLSSAQLEHLHTLDHALLYNHAEYQHNKSDL